MAISLVERLTALNPWLAEADLGDVAAVAERAARANGVRLAERPVDWTPWAGGMAAIAERLDDGDRALFDAVALTDLGALPEPIDLFALVFPGALRLRGRRLERPAAIENCRIGGDLSLDDVDVAAGLSLQSSTVARSFRISTATLNGRIDFAGLSVGGDASFENVVFEGDAWHQKAVFSGAVSWRMVDFNSDAGFQTAEFRGRTRFDQVNFYGSASFENAFFGALSESDAVAFFRRCFIGGAAGAVPPFLREPTAPTGAAADNVRRLPARRGRTDRQDAG